MKTKKKKGSLKVVRESDPWQAWGNDSSIHTHQKKNEAEDNRGAVFTSQEHVL